jgi:hypothetical protein
MRRAGQATTARRRVAGRSRAPTSPTNCKPPESGGGHSWERCRPIAPPATPRAAAATPSARSTAPPSRSRSAGLPANPAAPSTRTPNGRDPAERRPGRHRALQHVPRQGRLGRERHLIDDPGRRHRSRSAVHFSRSYSSRSISASPPGSPSSRWTSANPRPPCAITWPWPPGTRRPRHHQDLLERERRILPTHVQTAWPLTPDPGPPDLSSHVASAGSAMDWLNSSRALRLCDRLASSTFTGSISPAANLL